MEKNIKLKMFFNNFNRSRQLRTASNRLLMSLTVADALILFNCYQVVIQVSAGGPVLGTIGKKLLQNGRTFLPNFPIR